MLSPFLWGVFWANAFHQAVSAFTSFDMYAWKYGNPISAPFASLTSRRLLSNDKTRCLKTR